MLKVTVAEVRRDIVKQMGVDLSASMNVGTTIVKFNNNNPVHRKQRARSSPAMALALTVRLDAVGHSDASRDGKRRCRADARRTQSDGDLRRVRDVYLRRRISHSDRRDLPNDDGRRIGQCVQTVSYKKFGISLNFTPVVLSEGRISLRVMTEVSEVSTENALTGGAGGTTIPSIKTRRAETTLEIPSGGSMAMAGLIQEQTKQAVNGLPGLDQLPVLGALFRSQDFVNNQTELMVLVTPYVVRAVAQKELSRPDDGFAPASDSQSTLLARINRIYGLAARVDTDRRNQGNFGFIID